MSIRITQNSVNRSYLSNLSNSQYSMNTAMDKVQSGRAFTKVSENVSAGTKALNIRSKIYKNEQVRDNVAVANEQLTVAEDSLVSINEIVGNIRAEVLKVLNGTNTKVGEEIYTTVLQNSKDSILKLANCKYNDKYIMGGTNIKTQPYTVDANGKFQFNGVNVEDIELKNGKFESNGTSVPYSSDTYIDIGLDICVVNGVVDPRTAYKVSVSGLDSLGYGKSDITYKDMSDNEKTYEVSNNVYDVITDMSKAIEDGDMDKLSALYDHLGNCANKLATNVSDIGMRCSFLDATLSRLENESLSLSQMQKDTEGIDDATEIMNYMNYKYAWNLTMQFGSNVIPQSLMDFIR